MTRTISLITATVGAALLFAVPAYGDNWGRDLAQQTTSTSPDWFERAAAVAIEKQNSVPIVSENTPESQYLVAERLRGEALNRQYGLGEFAVGTASSYRDAHERVVEPQSVRAERIRSEALNRKYGLGEYGTASSYRDAHERAVPPVSSTPVSVTPTSSDRDVEWPQLGIAFGIGIALLLGLFLAMRTMRGRELAH
jgi:hypothetical protein